MSKIKIVEVGPRDGLQSEPEILPTESKVAFIEKAIDAGIRRLEVASFVHPKLVPQMADAYAAVAAGVTYLDASIGGIGGCPFAPAATGNIPTDDLLYMLDRSGIETGVSLENIMDTSRWLEGELGRSVPALLPKAGGFPTGEAT